MSIWKAKKPGRLGEGVTPWERRGRALAGVLPFAAESARVFS